MTEKTTGIHNVKPQKPSSRAKTHNDSETILVTAVISGKVQRVFFRASARHKAQELALVGYVQNVPDEKVILVAEGQKKNIRELLGWVRRGPQFANVEAVKVHWEKASGTFSDFSIR